MLQFDIDANQLRTLIDNLGATDKQARAAMSRALRRTAANLRTMSLRGFKRELDLKRMEFVRRRLKSIRLRQTADGIALWYGLNDLPVSALKGRLARTPTGASYRGKVGTFEFADGFIMKGKLNNKLRSIFYRQGDARFPLAEATVPIKDRMDVFIEDQIFVNVEDIFWRNFERDLRARIEFGVGMN